MWQTVGHQKQKLFLENALSNKRYAHAYLFCGPSQVGKRTLALEFANKLLGVAAADAKRFNPDLIVVDNQKIEEMRKLIADLSLKPYTYAYKVAVIDNFENVSEEAANSILKTLEEPSPTTVIILIARNRKAVLPTIVSRTQTLFFNRLNTGQLSAVVADSAALPLFDGRIGKAMRYAGDTDFRDSADNALKALQQLRGAEQPNRLLAIAQYADLDSDQLNGVFEHWLDAEHYSIRSNPERYKNLALLSDAIAGLRQNFNKKLVLQKLFLHLT